ncbi:unnamed protein product, partial [Chrysoparadoxa australica]
MTDPAPPVEGGELFELIQAGQINSFLAVGSHEASYLPLLLQLLRDTEGGGQGIPQNATPDPGSERSLTLDRLVEVAVRSPDADTVDSYLGHAAECCVEGLKQHDSKGKVTGADQPEMKEEAVVEQTEAPKAKGRAKKAKAEGKGGKSKASKGKGKAQAKGSQSKEEAKGQGKVASGKSPGKETVTPVVETKVAQGLPSFEVASPRQRLAIVLKELLRLMKNALEGATADSDLLGRRGMEEELRIILPVLLAAAPSLKLNEVTCAVMRARSAPRLLEAVVQNDPLALDPVVEGVGMTGAAIEGGSDRLKERALQTLHQLSGLSRATARRIRASLYAKRCMPSAWVALTCTHLHDPDLFVLQMEPEAMAMVTTEGQALPLLEALLNKMTEKCPSSSTPLLQFRACACLVAASGLQLTSSHVEMLTQAIRKLPSCTGRLLEVVTVALVVGLAGTDDGATREAVVSCLQGIWSTLDKDSAPACTILHLLLILMRNDQNGWQGQVTAALSAALGYALPEGACASLLEAVPAAWLDEASLASKVSQLGPPRKGTAACSCVAAALRLSLPQKHRFELRDWVLAAAKAGAADPVMLEVIELYADACVPRESQGGDASMKRRGRQEHRRCLRPIRSIELDRVNAAYGWEGIPVPSY